MPERTSPPSWQALLAEVKRVLSLVSRELAAAAVQLPLLLRRPGGLRHWLASAGKVQVVALVFLVLGLTAVPPVCESVAEAVFPAEVRRGGFFGLRRTVRTAPEAETLGSLLLVVYWLGAAATTGGMLLLHVPRAIATVPASRREGDDDRGALPVALPPVGEEPQSRDESASVAHTMWAGGTSSSGMSSRGAPTDGAPTDGTVTDPVARTMLAGSVEGTGAAVAATASSPAPVAVSPQRTEGARTAVEVPSPGQSVASGASSGPVAIVPGGRYEVEAEVGRGGMGIVYRARDRVLDRLVALKELPPEFRCNESLAARFEREARVLAQLTHTNIVQVYDLVHEGGRMWMAMELIQGGSLAELLEARGALVVEEVTRLGGDLARALSFAHQRGVIHRDFKPGNVLLTPEGVPKVTDFGLAKLMQQAPTLTHAGSVLGSPSYMSPEQAAGRDVDARSDIYSFGVTLYEMATGRTPFQGDTMSVMRQHLTQEPPPPRDHAEQLPGSLESLILAMLAKDPAERTPDMETVAAKLGG